MVTKLGYCICIVDYPLQLLDINIRHDSISSSRASMLHTVTDPKISEQLSEVVFQIDPYSLAQRYRNYLYVFIMYASRFTPNSGLRYSRSYFFPSKFCSFRNSIVEEA